MISRPPLEEAAAYRKRAREARTAAAGATDPVTRKGLLLVAREWDLSADDLVRRIGETDPPAE